MTSLQPDVALLEPRPDFYAAAHPGPEDVLVSLSPQLLPRSFRQVGAEIPGPPAESLQEVAGRGPVIRQEAGRTERAKAGGRAGRPAARGQVGG
jgi:hypothetical protein